MKSFRLEKTEGQELPPFVYVLGILAGVASGLWLLGVHPILLACIAVGMAVSWLILDVPGEGLRTMGTVRGLVLWTFSTLMFAAFSLIVYAVFTGINAA